MVLYTFFTSEFWLKLVITALFTVFIEGLVVFIYKRKHHQLILIAIIMNLITNLGMNTILTIGPKEWTGWDFLVFAEVFVFLFEASIYYLILKKYKDAILLSFIANLTSLLLGLTLLPFLF